MFVVYGWLLLVDVWLLLFVFVVGWLLFVVCRCALFVVCSSFGVCSLCDNGCYVVVVCSMFVACC